MSGHLAAARRAVAAWPAAVVAGAGSVRALADAVAAGT